ncbi:nucleotidyltransferase domain-containing protein [Tychonema bourrellyi FEM_GT703]|uniref:Nucleotidyltransferase domain-containing protein n=1 Tax=Tychonema bourrellyi FEM_GT703 TaxID=2040638 RepID=A0A2G4F0U8_9CYAN|nr:nucleotidyltransferase domain-containing protein [Tychonema bourrellyi]PHX55368.1 nucleotidyltransferase domain-containing protein [Tychonema bourrellyi FEM_GT703]
MLQISPTLTELQEIASQLPEQIPYLKMLILFGSRARGDTHAKSDWDFAALYDEKLREEYCQDRGFSWFEVPGILGQVFGINSDEIDVVELNRCSPLVANFIARDGKLLYEKESGQFERFVKTHLMNDLELQELERELYQSINDFLKDWRSV